MRRRVVTIGAALAGMGLAGARSAAAQASAGGQPARGPAVWLDLDQAALDAAYDQSVQATPPDSL